MRLQCLVCKRHFERSEKFVTLTSLVNNSQVIGKGVSLSVCAKHLSGEITDALLLNTPGWSDHNNQVYAERRVFGD